MLRDNARQSIEMLDAQGRKGEGEHCLLTRRRSNYFQSSPDSGNTGKHKQSPNELECDC